MSPLAQTVRIWDEYSSLRVRAARAGETADEGLTYALAGGRIAERENVERRNVLMFGDEAQIRTGKVSANDAIRKALASLPAEGGRLYFPSGRYLIDGDGVEFSQRLGILLEGESRYSVRLVNGVTDGDMFRIHDCRMFGIENMEMFHQQQKKSGSYLNVRDSHIFHASHLRLQNPYRGLQLDNIGGIHLYDVKMVPQNVGWEWNAGLYVQRCAGLFAHGLDINFGQNAVQQAAIVLEGGCDTIYFSNGGANQIGGSPGGKTGSVALHILNTIGAADPRWIRFSNFAFEAGGAPAVLIDRANDVQFIGAYAVNGINALNIRGGSNIKWLGGVMAATSEHVVQITGGQDIVLDNATIASGSWATEGKYSGVSIGAGADRVRVSDCHIGDATTIPGHAAKMAYGVALQDTSADKRHEVRGNTYGPQVVTRVYQGSPTSSVQTRRQTEGVQAPTIGSWEVGDYVRNTHYLVQDESGVRYAVTGWHCVDSGTPGTWVAERLPLP